MSYVVALTIEHILSLEVTGFISDLTFSWLQTIELRYLIQKIINKKLWNIYKVYFSVPIAPRGFSV
jgi:hypothetical protein